MGDLVKKLNELKEKIKERGIGEYILTLEDWEYDDRSKICEIRVKIPPFFFPSDYVNTEGKSIEEAVDKMISFFNSPNFYEKIKRAEKEHHKKLADDLFAIAW